MLSRATEKRCGGPHADRGLPTPGQLKFKAAVQNMVVISEVQLVYLKRDSTKLSHKRWLMTKQKREQPTVF